MAVDLNQGGRPDSEVVASPSCVHPSDLPRDALGRTARSNFCYARVRARHGLEIAPTAACDRWSSSTRHENRELTCTSKIRLQSRKSAFEPRTLGRSGFCGFWRCEKPAASASF